MDAGLLIDLFLNGSHGTTVHRLWYMGRVDVGVMTIWEVLQDSWTGLGDYHVARTSGSFGKMDEKES